LPSPEADYAVLPIIAIATLTNSPLFLTYFTMKIYQRIKARREAKNSIESKGKIYKAVELNEPKSSDSSKKKVKAIEENDK
jgi:hypothetical protein